MRYYADAIATRCLLRADMLIFTLLPPCMLIDTPYCFFALLPRRCFAPLLLRALLLLYDMPCCAIDIVDAYAPAPYAFAADKAPPPDDITRALFTYADIAI